jgi:hypothetical protein
VLLPGSISGASHSVKLTVQQLDYLNIGLLLVSCVCAFVSPFELFLFSYAVLGPLHYLTEVSWLHDRGYFVNPRNAGRSNHANRLWLSLVSITLAVMLFGAIAEKILGRLTTPVWEIGLFYLVFLTAALLIFVKNTAVMTMLIGLAVVALFLFSFTQYYALLAFFLITIVHVLVFTAAFMLNGALKSRSLSGILSLAVFLVCAASFFFYNPGALGHTVGDYARSSYSSFQALNVQLLRILHLGTGKSLQEIYESSAGLAVMRLIAFAYTYHYLNWFSKTSIIKWHEIPRTRGALILGLWIASLALYASNYETGMIALYLLSVLHVMLEFPLNHHTFASIGRQIQAL